MTEYIILMPIGIQLFGLLPVVLRDPYIRKKQKKIMVGILALITLLVAQNVTEYALQTYVSMPHVRTLVSILGYALRPFIIVMFCELVSPNKRHVIGWVLVAINALIYATATFSHIVFFIDEYNKFQRGPLSYTAFIISAVLLLDLVFCTIIEYRQRKATVWIAVVNIVIVVISIMLEISPAYHDYSVNYLTIAVVSCSLFYYIWLHLEFVREHEDALKAEQRIKIMMSQIQPHFLYNTLSTIQALCRTDPKKAFEVTERFSTYLRSNIDSLNQPNLIPLAKELEHTRIYAEIEMIRFPNIRVEYDIQTDAFSVPALSIQPLVENAIRHGVRIREQGIVSVATREENSFYLIVIRDNGIGFDAAKAASLEGDHIGIANVRERIEKMCGGTLTIDSKRNEGTAVTMTLPKQVKE